MSRAEHVTAVRIETTPAALVIVLLDREAQIPWANCSRKLAAAGDLERQRAHLTPGGYGVHWPLLDEDLSITGLLRSHASARS